MEDNKENVPPLVDTSADTSVDTSAAVAAPEDKSVPTELPSVLGAVEAAPAPVEEPAPKKRKRRTKEEIAAEKAAKDAAKKAKMEERETARAKAKEAREIKERFEASRKALMAIDPPSDLELVSGVEGEGEGSLASEDEEEEDDIKMFAKSLREYMDIQVAESMRKYKQDAVAAAEAQAMHEKEMQDAIQLAAPPKLTRQTNAANQYQRARPRIFFL